jgi:hypothetical protein
VAPGGRIRDGVTATCAASIGFRMTSRCSASTLATWRSTPSSFRPASWSCSRRSRVTAWMSTPPGVPAARRTSWRTTPARTSASLPRLWRGTAGCPCARHPFPMPTTGAEVMWNMKMRYRGVGFDMSKTVSGFRRATRAAVGCAPPPTGSCTPRGAEGQCAVLVVRPPGSGHLLQLQRARRPGRPGRRGHHQGR